MAIFALFGSTTAPLYQANGLPEDKRMDECGKPGSRLIGSHMSMGMDISMAESEKTEQYINPSSAASLLETELLGAW